MALLYCSSLQELIIGYIQPISATQLEAGMVTVLVVGENVIKLIHCLKTNTNVKRWDPPWLEIFQLPDSSTFTAYISK